MKKASLSLLLLIATAAQAGPPITWGPDNKALLFQGGFEVPQVATPTGNPPANYNYLYFKSDNHLYLKTSAGTETQVDGGGGGSFLPLAGGTMSGPIVIPTSTASTGEITAGTANTGLFFPTAAFLAWTSAGTELWRTSAGGIAFGSTAAQTARVYIAQSSTQDTGLIIESGSTAGRKMSMDFSGANLFSIGKVATNGAILIAHTATGGTGADWISIGANSGAIPAYPQEVDCASADGNVTALSSIKSLDGVNINGAPWLALINRNATVNTIAQYITAGSSKNPMAAFGSRHVVQTATSEVAEVMISNQDGGTLTEHLRIKRKGLWEAGGALPTVTCNGASATVEAGSSGTYARFTIPATPGTSCAVTMPDTADSNPICNAVDEGISAMEVMTCSSTTACTIADAGMVAGNKIAFHCGAHL